MAVQLLPLTLATPPRRPPREDHPRTPEEMPQSAPDMPDEGAPDLPDPLPVESPDPAPSEAPPVETRQTRRAGSTRPFPRMGGLALGKPFQLVHKTCETA